MKIKRVKAWTILKNYKIGLWMGDIITVPTRKKAIEWLEFVDADEIVPCTILIPQKKRRASHDKPTNSKNKKGE